MNYTVFFLCFCYLAFSSITNIGLQKGDPAPNFTEKDIEGNVINLSKLVKTGNVVLLFYRGFWCEHCHKQLSHFNEALEKIAEKGGHTIAVSPTPFSSINKKISNPNKHVSVIIDTDLSILEAYKVLTHEKHRYTRNELIYQEEDFSFIPATYIIDENMEIKFSHIDPDFTVNAFVDSTLVHP